MMKDSKIAMSCMALAAFAVMAGGSPHRQGSPVQHGMAVAYPWEFKGGDETSKKTARQTADEIARKAGYASVPGDVARSAWRSAGLPSPRFNGRPSEAQLQTFGKAVHAQEVLFGDVDWNTRSIWVGLGPKTISTATVNVYVLDVPSGRIVYRKEHVEGRSDEPENGWKVAADVLVTPLVTAVSGGPATPREQRAVQIALGKAYHDWVRGSRS